VFECFFAWYGYTPSEVAETTGIVGTTASETAAFYYYQNGGGPYPDALAGAWGVSGNCPSGYQATVAMSGGTDTVDLSTYGTSASYTWYVTVSAYCVSGTTQFAFFTRWEPPEIPLTWLLRGGTNTLAPLEPLYLEAWDTYVRAWLAVNGFMLDLLILLALIMPILARPGLRRLKLT
jgi:hypothetical protein